MAPAAKQTAELIDRVFKEHFANPELTSDDAAVLAVEKGKLAFTTDGFIVSPAEFPGRQYWKTEHMRYGQRSGLYGSQTLVPDLRLCD